MGNVDGDDEGWSGTMRTYVGAIERPAEGLVSAKNRLRIRAFNPKIFPNYLQDPKIFAKSTNKTAKNPPNFFQLRWCLKKCAGRSPVPLRRAP